MYHNLEVESWSPLALHGRYVPLSGRWASWKVLSGVWAVFPPEFAYIGSAFIQNTDSDWWVIHCTCWAINFILFLLWDAFDTGRLWHISPRFCRAIRAMPLPP